MGKGLQLPLRKQGVYTVSLVPEIFLGLHTYPTHEVANLSTEQAGNLQSSPREKQPDSVKDLLPKVLFLPCLSLLVFGVFSHRHLLVCMLKPVSSALWAR